MWRTVPSGRPKAWAILLPLSFSIRWGYGVATFRLSRAVVKPSLPFVPPYPLAHGVAGDGEPAGSFPQAPTSPVDLHNLKPHGHFAFLVGEPVSFGEGKDQQGGIPPFLEVWMNLRIGGMPHILKNPSNASRSGLRGGSPCLGASTPLVLTYLR